MKKLRIAIYETSEKIVEGGYGDFYNTIERKTAIEKMAKAMCYNQSRYIVWKNCDGKSCDKCRYYINWLQLAEAALNALLEDE